MSKQSLIFISALLLFSVNLYAEVVTDGSLGTNVGGSIDLLNSNYDLSAKLGQKKGDNLFHSFETFNLNAGESATFSGPDSIQNVISRVTGGNPSQIDGTIRSTIPNADMYLLNPYGIMFGPNAKLDVQGSFHASTAHYLDLGKNKLFYSDLGNESVLSVAPPKAFGFLDTPAPLSLNSSSLELKGNKTLSLIGGPLTITDSTLFAPDGDINLVGMDELQMIDSTVYAPAGRVSLLATGLQDRIPTSFEALASSRLIGGGTINISDTPDRMNNILSKRTQSSPALNKLFSLFYGMDINAFQEQSPTLKKSLSEFDKELFSRYEQDADIANIDTNGKGGGQVVIRAGKFFLDGSSIYADNYGGTDGGDIDINIQGDMRLTNSARITAGAMDKLEENMRGGNISIQAGKLEMNGISKVQVDSLIDQWAQLLETPPESFQQQFGMDEHTFFEQQFGMDKSEVQNFVGSLQTAISELLEQGVEVSLDKMVNKMDEKYEKNIPKLFYSILNTIGTSNFSHGIGGNISIDTPVLNVDQSVIETSTGEGNNSGHAGDISINAQNISLKYGFITTTTIGIGKAGDITIQGFNQPMADRISVTDMSSIIASSQNYPESGDAGNINLKTHHLVLKNGGYINSFSYDGTGKAGSIYVETDTAILSDKGSGIYTESDTRGGNIDIKVADRLELFNDSRITAEAFGEDTQDSGGNITIESPDIFTLDNSQLRANAYAGNGGKIDITTRNFQISGNSRIDVSSDLGLNGEFILNSVKLRDDFLTLPVQNLLKDKLLLSRCIGLTQEDLSSFFITNRDVSPTAPTDLNTHPYTPTQ